MIFYISRRDNQFGIDLRALDIQRERDHGVATYVEARRYCNLPVPNDFDDLVGYMPDDVSVFTVV